MKTWLVGDTIPFRVRTNGDPASDNPTATVLDNLDALVGAPLTIGDGITQVGTTKVVKGSFIPTVAGEWSVTITDDAGMNLVKEYIVRTASIESIGTGLNAVAGSLVAIDGKVTAQDAVLAAILAQTQGGGHFG